MKRPLPALTYRFATVDEKPNGERNRHQRKSCTLRRRTEALPWWYSFSKCHVVSRYTRESNFIFVARKIRTLSCRFSWNSLSLNKKSHKSNSVSWKYRRKLIYALKWSMPFLRNSHSINSVDISCTEMLSKSKTTQHKIIKIVFSPSSKARLPLYRFSQHSEVASGITWRISISNFTQIG